MGSNKISAKEQIIKFKDYADIADASYAMLNWVSENERNGLDNNIDKNNQDEIYRHYTSTTNKHIFNSLLCKSSKQQDKQL